MRIRHTETDILRLLASFAVVLLHAAAAEMSAMTPGADGTWFLCLVNSLCRFSVPVFMMISGRYMLGGGCPIRRGLKKAGQTLLVLLGWSVLYFCYSLLDGWRPGSLIEVADKLLTEPVHLWYFYAAAAFYLFAPLLSVFTCHGTRGQLLYALTLTGFFGSVIFLLMRSGRFPLLGEILEMSKLPYAMGFLFCTLTGFYLARWPQGRRGGVLLAVCGLLGTVVTFVGTMWLSCRAGQWNELLMSFFAPHVVVAGAAVFALALRLGKWHIPDNWRRILGAAADTTGGIYGLHMLVLWLLPDWNLPVVIRGLAAWMISGAVVGAVKFLGHLLVQRR